MESHELELAVGAVLQIGETILTVLDIENNEVFFRIEDLKDGDPSSELMPVARSRPR